LALAIYLRAFTFQIKESLEETETVSGASDLNAILGQNKSIIRKKMSTKTQGWSAMGIELPIAKQNFLYGRTILARGSMN